MKSKRPGGTNASSWCEQDGISKVRMGIGLSKAGSSLIVGLRA